MKARSLATVLGGAAAGAGAVMAYQFVVRPWYLHWGATAREIQRSMPGDEVVANPSLAATWAVTIAARPERIWPWLVQTGYGRGGFYSYDWLERRMGLEIESTDRIVPEFQQIATGDTIMLGPQGPAAPVIVVEPYRWFVCGGADPSMGEASWAFGLFPVDDETTRLVARLRCRFPNWTLCSSLSGRDALRTLPMYLFFEPGAFIMMRKMLLGIKERAEGSSRAGAAG